MPNIIMEVPVDDWETVLKYAARVGLPAEMLAREALMHTIRSDRYGLEEAALLTLQRETRAAELRARQSRAGNPAVAKSVDRPGSSVQPLDVPTDTVDLPPEMLDTDLNLVYQDDNIPRDI